jgi:hypothetical protein
MGSTRSHPLPTGIFVEMKPPSSEFDDWTGEDFENEIKRLQKRVRELEAKKVARKEDDEDEVRVMSQEEVENDPRMTQSAAIRHADKIRAHFC